jgi:hypothetical protein
MQDRAKTRAGAATRPTEDLPYSIELWHEEQEAVERVLARALNVQLARAIYKAARGEHPDRRVVLRKGNRLVSDSAD